MVTETQADTQWRKGDVIKGGRGSGWFRSRPAKPSLAQADPGRARGARRARELGVLSNRRLRPGSTGPPGSRPDGCAAETSSPPPPRRRSFLPRLSAAAFLTQPPPQVPGPTATGATDDRSRSGNPGFAPLASPDAAQ